MRLSGLTHSGERTADFPVNNQRFLFASIVLAFGLVVVFILILDSFGGMGRAASCFGAFLLAR